LANLMYSSHGTTMPCFTKGSTVISDLEDRLAPAGLRTDGDLSLHCQSLVNSSIDNWRARWYDKWQYYMQGILY
jgi:phosphatidylinositol 4-kinase